MSERRIQGLFENFGILISAAYISQQWTQGYELFAKEKSELYRAGIATGSFTQIDDTSARVNGVNQYCQVVCSPWFTAYFTTPKKDRLSVLSVLNNAIPPLYRYDPKARELLETFKLSNKAQAAISSVVTPDVVMNKIEFEKELGKIEALGERQVIHLKDACAIAWYQQQTDFPVVKILLADDAPQFKLITEHLALCWVHDGRHYKKLGPVVPMHQKALSDMLSRYWAYYTELLKFKSAPADQEKTRLAAKFDELFSSVTGYDDLDDRIAKTLAKKAELLLVLEYPELPLHNNDSELGARVQARVRDVSFQTRSEEGTKIKDTFMTINQTAKKLGVSFFDYVFDRVTGTFKMPSLADVIMQKSRVLQT